MPMLHLSQIWGCLQDAEVVIKKKQTKLVVGKLLSYLDAFSFGLGFPLGFTLLLLLLFLAGMFQL